MCMNLTPLISVGILKLFSKVFDALFVSISFKCIQVFSRVCLYVYTKNTQSPCDGLYSLFVLSPLSHRDSIAFGRMHFKALFTPGHTVGHMIYLLDGRTIGSPSSLFSGDLVFLSGCGRLHNNKKQSCSRDVAPLCSWCVPKSSLHFI